jgi:hypothetical protein
MWGKFGDPQFRAHFIELSNRAPKMSNRPTKSRVRYDLSCLVITHVEEFAQLLDTTHAIAVVQPYGWRGLCVASGDSTCSVYAGEAASSFRFSFNQDRTSSVS